MWNEPTKERLARIPKLYETEDIPLREKQIVVHFFLGSADWYVAEFDGRDTFFGFVHLGDDQNAEWGYFSFNELRSLRVHGWLEVDCELEEFWQVKMASEIAKIREASGWKTDVDGAKKVA